MMSPADNSASVRAEASGQDQAANLKTLLQTAGCEVWYLPFYTASTAPFARGRGGGGGICARARVCDGGRGRGTNQCLAHKLD